jgi:ADP-ribosylation factor GTPase-activating protein 2/3
MGVHISFVKSTVLDKWTPDHLLNMVCGGNANANAYFKAKGWIDEGGDGAQSGGGGAGGSAKFTCKAALAYRVHLEKEVAKNRDRLIDTLNEGFGTEAGAAAAAAANASAVKHDALDAEIAQLTLKSGDVRPAKPTPSPPPITTGEDGQPVEKPKAPVRQVIRKVHAPPAADAAAAAAASPSAAASAAAADPSTPSDAAALDLDGANLTSLLSTSKAKKSTTSSMRSQLSTKKAAGKTSILAGGGGAPVRSSGGAGGDGEDEFDVAAREAADSAQRVAREREEAAARAAAPAPAASPKPAAASSEPKQSRESGPDPNLAKYSKSTSISSDQYFERESYAKSDETDRARLAQFANANAIGSDAYFGHGDGEDGEHYGHGGGGDGELADAVAQTVQGIKGLAKGLFKGIQSRYG